MSDPSSKIVKLNIIPVRSGGEPPSGGTEDELPPVFASEDELAAKLIQRMAKIGAALPRTGTIGMGHAGGASRRSLPGNWRATFVVRLRMGSPIPILAGKYPQKM